MRASGVMKSTAYSRARSTSLRSQASTAAGRGIVSIPGWTPGGGKRFSAAGKDGKRPIHCFFSIGSGVSGGYNLRCSFPVSPPNGVVLDRGGGDGRDGGGA